MVSLFSQIQIADYELWLLIFPLFVFCKGDNIRGIFESTIVVEWISSFLDIRKLELIKVLLK